MSLVSLWFAIFAAVLGAAYYLVPHAHQWRVLLAASCVFYLWAGPEYLAFLLFTAISTWHTAVVMEKRVPHSEAKQRARRAENKGLLALCIAGNAGMLFVCKACLIQPVSAALSGSHISFLTLGLPLGISFYLFQSVGYVVDVYRGTVPAERSFFRFLLFAAYFPQLIQGPISRYSQLAPQLYAPHTFDGKQVSFGAQRMLGGYFKKLVIADRLAPAVAVLRGVSGNGWAFGLLTLFYAVQLYADFTGGIDIVLGLSQSLGITLPENFHRPFFSKNTAEYWRRWHISLGEWMKEYIFYPVSVSRPLLRLGRAARRRWGNFGRRLPVYAASAITWFATGIWHGLTPNFILWGMLNWGVIVISEELSPLYQRFHSRFPWKQRRWYGWFEMARMFCLMNLIRVCDLYSDVWEYFRGLGSLLRGGSPVATGLTGLDWGIVGLGCIAMFAVSLLQEKKGSIRELLWKKPAARYAANAALFFAILLTGRYGVGYDPASFIYNQF